MAWKHEEAHELALYADNDAGLYRMKEPYVKAMLRHMKRGTYDVDKGIKLWMYYAERAAKSYAREHGSMGDKWSTMFPRAARLEASEHWEAQARESIRRSSRDMGRRRRSLFTRTRSVQRDVRWLGLEHVEKQATLWHNRLAHIILYGVDEKGQEHLAKARTELSRLLEQRVPGNQKHRTALWWKHKKESLTRMWREANEVSEGRRRPKLR